MEKNIRQMYLECSCLPRKLVYDIGHFFEYAEQILAEKSFKQLSLEQLDMFSKLDEIYKQSSTLKEDADRYHNQILLSLVPSIESQKLQEIRKYLEKCECPFMGIDYKHTGSFHNYPSVKKFFENLGMKIE